MASKEEICSNCKYSYIRGSYLFCRRFPPAANMSDFPSVKFNDWCGEFEEKPKKKILSRKKK